MIVKIRARIQPQVFITLLKFYTCDCMITLMSLLLYFIKVIKCLLEELSTIYRIWFKIYLIES
jgi:hypothetical protein